MCQPLNVAFFRPLKIKWRKILDDWKGSQKKKSQNLNKNSFPCLLRKLCEEISPNNHSDNLISGFKKCGIVRYNPESLLNSLAAYRDCVNTEDRENIPGVVISNVVVDMLKKLQHGDTEQTKKRRSKINVPAGQSISVEDLIANKENINNKIKKKEKQPKRKIQKLKTILKSNEKSEDTVSINDSDDIPYRIHLMMI